MRDPQGHVSAGRAEAWLSSSRETTCWGSCAKSRTGAPVEESKKAAASVRLHHVGHMLYVLLIFAHGFGCSSLRAAYWSDNKVCGFPPLAVPVCELLTGQEEP